MNKNTIPLIIIVIVIICFGLGGLALVIYNIKNDEKLMFAPHDKPSEMIHHGHGDNLDVKPSEMMHHDDPDDSHKDEH